MITTTTGRPTPASVNFGPVYTGLTTIVYRLVNLDATARQDWTLATPLAELGGGIYTLTFTLMEPWAGTIEFDTALAAGNVESEEVLVTGQSLTADHVPAVDDIGALLRTRTRDENSNELGTFTIDTRPTGAQAQAAIAGATGEFAARYGDTIAPALTVAAREVITLRAALMIELGFFGDQILAGRSPYNELKALYDQAWQAFLDARRDLGADQLAGTEDDLSPHGLAVYAFTDPNQSWWHVPGTELAYPPVTAGPWW